jgi:uncharacterized protein GlcG (DUF336 family)
MGAAKEKGAAVAVAVVDAGGNLKALATMDDAPEGYAGAALSKVKGGGGRREGR